MTHNRGHRGRAWGIYSCVRRHTEIEAIPPTSSEGVGGIPEAGSSLTSVPRAYEANQTITNIGDNMTDNWKLERFKEIARGMKDRTGKDLCKSMTKQQKIDLIDALLAEYPPAVNNPVGSSKHE